jgi:hypothetical protein
MKVSDIIREPTKEDLIKIMRAKILKKRKNPVENEPDVGWNQDPHQGNTPGAMLYR